MREARFEILLGSLLLTALAVRVGYVAVQPTADPSFFRPMLDGAYYVDWARSLAAGEPGPDGAYYLAPLYPWFLAVFFRMAGEQVALLYLLQHAFAVAGGWLLALTAARCAGKPAALATAGLAVVYHPTLFFSSRPIGESLALGLLAAALLLLGGQGRWSAAGAGGLAGLASLARPNLLLVLVGGVAVELVRRRPGRALLVLGAGLLVLIPVGVRNWVVSGHPVPVSSNAGMTLYHGNAPGATGIGLLPAGFTGSVLTQRAEAAAIASRAEGRRLDPVEADRWWGRQAVRARWTDPAGTLRLGARRALLTLSNAELSLDYAPAIDENPWRRAVPLPFALLLGLAAAGVALAGFSGTGGAAVWSAIAATAATPIAFYVSSRYRLPFAFLLAIPAGIGLAALLSEASRRRRALAALLAVGFALGSLLVPVAEVRATTTAGALANRAVAWKQAGELDAAETDLRRALEIDPRCWQAWFGLGVVLEARGHSAEAAGSYEQALAVQPAAVAAACNLARMRILQGRFDEAIVLARRALDFQVGNTVCWSQVVTARYLGYGVEAGREATDEALRAGAVIDAELLRALEESLRRPHTGEEVD